MRPQSGKPKILDAAKDLFVEQGYFATTVSQITQRAGVSKGLVYNYYDSKEDLLVDLIDSYTTKMEPVAETLAVANKSHDPLSIFVDNFFLFLKKEKNFLKMQLSLMLMPELEKIVKEPMKNRSELLLIQITKELKNQKVSLARNKAYLFLALLDGIALHYLSIYEDYPLNSIKLDLKKKLHRLYTN